MADSLTAPKQRFLAPEARLAYLLLLPAVVVLVGFMIYPLVYVVLMSLSTTNRLGWLTHFAGLKNFLAVLGDGNFWRVTGRSLIWTALAVFVKMSLGMVIALLLNVEFPGRKVAHMLFIAPWASSVPISVLLWSWVYTPEFGLLNHTLRMLGLTGNPPVWLGYPISAFIAAIWVDIWIGVPFMALVFLAGMKSIPEDQYESAHIDGVNAVQKFAFITLPGIRHLVLVATLLSALWTFNDFNVIWILTAGGPVDTTDILITSIYKYAFVYLKFDQASVMAVVTFLILTGISAVYAKFYFAGERRS